MYVCAYMHVHVHICVFIYVWMCVCECMFTHVYPILHFIASKLASTYFTLFYRSVHVLNTEICILGGCLCKWTTQLSVFNCRLESNICA